MRPCGALIKRTGPHDGAFPFHRKNRSCRATSSRQSVATRRPDDQAVSCTGDNGPVFCEPAACSGGCCRCVPSTFWPGDHGDEIVDVLPASSRCRQSIVTRRRAGTHLPADTLPNIGCDTLTRSNSFNAICQNIGWNYLNGRNYLIYFLLIKQNIRAGKGILVSLVIQCDCFRSA